MQTLVNADKLYSIIGKFFSNHQNLVTELIQNSLRAKANHINIALPYKGEHPFEKIEHSDRLLRIEDDGKGITDLIALLGIAISDWDSDIDYQDPAGMGFLQLIALSKQVSVQSKFGQLIIDSQRFLKDSSYRLTTLTAVNKKQALTKGTIIIAEMKDYPWSYMQDNNKWYKGYFDAEVTMNGELMEYKSIEEMVTYAQSKNNMYRIEEFKGNKLLITIGDINVFSDISTSLINWYGQFIPVYLNNCIANSRHISFYYEVRNGTPLTPRYPDRHSLIQDELYGELKKFVCDIAFEMVKEYFNNMHQIPKFAMYINHNLLISFYNYATPEEMFQIPHIPLEINVLGHREYSAMSISTKQSLIENGYSYCHNIDNINDDYLLAGDDSDLKSVLVNDKVAAHLKELGVPQLIKVEAEAKPESLVNINPLVLIMTYADGTKRSISLDEALLIDGYNNVYVYAPASQDVLSVFHNLFDYSILYEEDRCSDDIYDDVIDNLKADLINRFSVINRDKFRFLPEYGKIRNISFEFGNLAIAYDDGRQSKYELKG